MKERLRGRESEREKVCASDSERKRDERVTRAGGSFLARWLIY